MNWYKQSQTEIPITIDLNEYKNQIDNYLDQLVDEPISLEDFNQMSNLFRDKVSNLQSLLNQKNITDYNSFLEQLKNLELSVNNIDFISGQLWNMRVDKIVSDYKIFMNFREVSRIFYTIEKYIKNFYFTFQEKQQVLSGLVAQTQQNMEKIKDILSNLINSANSYKGKKFPIILEAQPAYDTYGNDFNIDSGSDSALLYVGKKDYYLMMSIYLADNDIKILGDEVEDFNELEEEFGSIISKMQPFYNLIRSIIKNPNQSSNKAKNITIYTARNITDFKQFNDATAIPVNIFVSNKYDYVEGFAMDHKPRDIWKIRLSDQYLISGESNNPDFVFQTYNPSGEDTVPIKSIQFIERIQ